MFFSRIGIAMAVALAPMPAHAQVKPGELPDLGRWNEIQLPGAPFRVDIPMPWKSVDEKDSSGSKVKTWRTAYGLMNIEVTFTDRSFTTSFTPRRHLEMLGGGLIPKWKNATAKVSDLTVAGHPAARLEMEHDVDSGRIRVERLLVRVGQDDWTVQTTRFTTDGAIDSMHIFRSIKAPAAPPVLMPAKIGRMTIKGFGKPVIVPDKLAPDSPYEKWVSHAFEYQGNTRAWVYNIRVKPGQAFNAQGAAQMLIDNVVQQSNPKPRVYPFAQAIGGYQGHVARGQAITGDGEECFRILAVGDGQEGWAILLAGPNTARSESMFRDMIASIQIAPQ